MSLTIHVEGTPAPQGSKVRTRFGMREASKRVKPWREQVTAAAIRAADDAYLLGPLTPPYAVTVDVFIRRPRTTRASHPVAPTVGDLDKHVRACLDSLTAAGVIEDDRFVIALTASKQWAGAGETPGAVIRVQDHYPTEPQENR